MAKVAVTVEATTYTVNAVPDEVTQYYLWELTVEKRGPGQWAVLHQRFCLGSDGSWEYEMRPSAREDDWLETHRFDLSAALDLAQREAPKVTVNGITVAEVLRRHAAKTPEN